MSSSNPPMVPDPLEQLRAAREAAREAGDPAAALCSLAINTPARPALRTLVLRDFEGGYAVFVNATSAKWREATAADGKAAVLVWLPSQQSQFRLDVQLLPIPKEQIDREWQLRPQAAMRLDQLYESQPQGSEIASREQLLALITAIDPENLRPPPAARGWKLEVVRMEILVLDTTTGIHDRRSYQPDGADWIERILIP